MAGRLPKPGLQFFGLDCDIFHERKIRRLRRKFNRGFEVYVSLLCEIYRDRGYYVEVDDGFMFDLAETLNTDEEQVREIVNYCLEIDLFDRGLFSQKSLLTSRGIQRRYVNFLRNLKRKFRINEELYLLKAEDLTHNSEEIPQPSEEMPPTPEESLNNSAYNILYNTIIKENISIRISPKEIERFLEILFFDKRLIHPAAELDRFISHYEASGWCDGNGVKVKNRIAKLKIWNPPLDAKTLPPEFLKKWKTLYVVARNNAAEGSYAYLQLMTDLRGYSEDAATVRLTVTAVFANNIQASFTKNTPFAETFNNVFGGKKLQVKQIAQ